jgi:aminopeptidase N
MLGADIVAGHGVTTGSKPGLVAGTVNATSINLRAEYDVKASLNFGTRAFKVSTTIQVRNDSGKPIDRLELNTIATRLGSMKLGAVTSAGKPVAAKVHDQTLRVPLGGILGAGQSVQVTVAYSATLRSSLTGSNWLFTRTNGIADVHRWIPWVSRDVPFDRPNHGDPFITPVSPRVRVAITSDRALAYATTGERIAKSGLTTTFEATNVRDFAFTAAPDYKSISTKVGDVTVRVYYRAGFPASSVLASAKHALSSFEALVGPYPYPVYNLAQTAGGYGMESPGLTWIPTGARNISYLVHHETGHQWFYGIVGSDQAYEPFTDEALTDFMARYVLSQRRASRCSTARLDLSIYRYSTSCYYEIIYIQGGNFIDDVRKTMGSTAFWAGIRDYVAKSRFRLATTKSLLQTLDDHTSKDLVPRYRPRFPRLY